MNKFPPLIGLHHIALNVVELEKCLDFYTRILGFRIEWQPDSENIYLTTGKDNLALHKVPLVHLQNKSLSHIGIVVPSIEAVYQWYKHLQNYHINLSSFPKEHRDGACSFYFPDPDGNVVQILYHPPLSGL